MVNRTGDVRQHSYPTHRGELTAATACAQPPVRPANPWTWVRSSFLTLRGFIGDGRAYDHTAEPSSPSLGGSS